MKNWMHKVLALLMVMMLATGTVAFAEKEISSEAFRFSGIKTREEAPAANVPVEETPADETPAEEPVAEEPVEEPAEEPGIVGGKATVTLSDETSRLNVRAEANAEAECLCSIDNGSVVTVLAEEGEWMKIVTADGIEGWAKASFLVADAAEEAAPAAEEQAPVEIDVSKLRVEIFSTQGDVVEVGETIVLSSRLTGFEGITYSVQWQFNSGSGWQDVEGATEETYSFVADEDNVSFQWRLVVSL